MPTLWVFAGPNGAGKTTLFNDFLDGVYIQVNADEIANELDRVGADLDILRAGRIAVERRERMLKGGRDLSIETTLSGNSALRFMARASRSGYDVNLAYIGLQSPELSAARVRDRVARGGHDVPLEAINRRYPDSLLKLSQALAIADSAFVFDNSREDRRLLLMRRDRRVLAVEPELPTWFINAVLRRYFT